MGIRSRRADGERGAAAVEFALVVPVLFLLVFGMIDFGWAINRYAAVSNAAREGVRMASLGGSPSEIEAVVQDAVGDLGPDGTTTVTVSCLRPSGVSCGPYSNAEPGGTAIIQVEYETDWLTIVGSTFSDGMNLTKTSRMRIE